MRVAVLGATGQLGTDVVRVLSTAGHDVVPLSHTNVEVTDPRSVRRAVVHSHPHAVVNCAAFHRVDECEERPEETFRVNALGALYVAQACAEQDALCAYIGTDYVFDGEQLEAYTEADAPNPINVYGASKAGGEWLVRQAAPRWLVARVSSLFGVAGARGKGGNFVETILRKARSGEPLRVVDDIHMSPTYAADAAAALGRLIADAATGIFHLSNLGACTWRQLAQEAVDLAGLDVTVEPVRSGEYPSKARRPRNSALQRTRSNGASAPRSWENALAAYLTEKGHI